MKRKHSQMSAATAAATVAADDDNNDEALPPPLAHLTDDALLCILGMLAMRDLLAAEQGKQSDLRQPHLLCIIVINNSTTKTTTTPTTTVCKRWHTLARLVWSSKRRLVVFGGAAERSAAKRHKAERDKCKCSAKYYSYIYNYLRKLRTTAEQQQKMHSTSSSWPNR